jgi:protein-S-isoprenylcysteine O-methyltransferase Ste14
MNRMLAFAYGVGCYVVFLGTFLLAIAFVGGITGPGIIDTNPAGPLVPSLLIDVALLGLFAVQHSVMARPAFKRWWTKFVPDPIERSTFVLVASLLLLLMIWQWRPLPTVVWDTGGGVARMLLSGLCVVGWLTVLLGTFMIDHFDLFGLRQVWLYLKGKPSTPVEFRTLGLYAWVRHPIMLGFIVAFWAAPRMTAGHLLFAAMTTAYVLVAIQLEERDLTLLHGDTYKAYVQRAGMLLPRLRRS